MGIDSQPHLSPNLHINLQIKMPKRKLRCETGLLNTPGHEVQEGAGPRLGRSSGRRRRSPQRKDVRVRLRFQPEDLLCQNGRRRPEGLCGEQGPVADEPCHRYELII